MAYFKYSILLVVSMCAIKLTDTTSTNTESTNVDQTGSLLTNVPTADLLQDASNGNKTIPPDVREVVEIHGTTMEITYSATDEEKDKTSQTMSNNETFITGTPVGNVSSAPTRVSVVHTSPNTPVPTSESQLNNVPTDGLLQTYSVTSSSPLEARIPSETLSEVANPTVVPPSEVTSNTQAQSDAGTISSETPIDLTHLPSEMEATVRSFTYSMNDTSQAKLPYTTPADMVDITHETDSQILTETSDVLTHPPVSPPRSQSETVMESNSNSINGTQNPPSAYSSANTRELPETATLSNKNPTDVKQISNSVEPPPQNTSAKTQTLLEMQYTTKSLSELLKSSVEISSSGTQAHTYTKLSSDVTEQIPLMTQYPRNSTQSHPAFSPDTPPINIPVERTTTPSGSGHQMTSEAEHTTTSHTTAILHDVTTLHMPQTDSTEEPSTANISVEQRLLSTLFKSYNSNARPVKSSSTTVQVKLYYTLVSLQNMNMKEQVMTAFGWIGMIWKDELLTWDENVYNVSNIVVDAEKVWLPDVAIWNSAGKLYGDDLLDPSKYKVEVSSTGTVTYFVAGSTETFCQMNLRTFPFDVQTCYIKLTSWTYSSAQVNLSAYDPVIDTSVYHESGQWNLHDTLTVNRNDIIDGVPFSGVKFILELKRKPLFYMVTFLIPCVLLSLIVLFVFLLPADAGEKVGLSITILLSFGVFQFMLIDYMPATSDYTPLITVYVIYVVVLSTLSLLFTVLLLILTFNDGSTKPPNWLRALAFGCVAKVTCKKRCCPKKKKDSDVDLIKFRSSRDRITFSGSGSSFEHDNSLATTNGSSMRVSYDFPKVWICEKKEQTAKENGTRSRVSTISLRPLNTNLASLPHKNQDNNSAKEEWLEIAQLFDRILLILFFIATMVIIIVVFTISPNIDNDFEPFDTADQVLSLGGRGG